MNWQAKMLFWGWRPSKKGGYVYRQKINGRSLTIPPKQAQVWQERGLIPTLQGVQRV